MILFSVFIVAALAAVTCPAPKDDDPYPCTTCLMTPGCQFCSNIPQSEETPPAGKSCQESCGTLDFGKVKTPDQCVYDRNNVCEKLSCSQCLGASAKAAGCHWCKTSGQCNLSCNSINGEITDSKMCPAPPMASVCEDLTCTDCLTNSDKCTFCDYSVAGYRIYSTCFDGKNVTRCPSTFEIVDKAKCPMNATVSTPGPTMATTTNNGPTMTPAPGGATTTPTAAPSGNSTQGSSTASTTKSSASAVQHSVALLFALIVVALLLL